MSRVGYIALNTLALILLILPISRRLRVLNIACGMLFIGIWIEKGMGLIIPGFIPTPLGEIVEYTPTLNETLICFGIWAAGLLIYTILVRITVPVLSGRLTVDGNTYDGGRLDFATDEELTAITYH